MQESAYLKSSEVDNTVNVGVCCEDLVKGFFIRDIDLIEVWALSADELDAV